MKEIITLLVDPKTFIGSMFFTAVFLVVYFILSKIINNLTKKIISMEERHASEKPAIEFYAQLLHVGSFIVLLIFYFHLIPSLKSVGTAMLTSVSVISVIGGFAAQKTLGNLLSGLSLIIYKPFKLGDIIQVTAPGGIETGEIKAIGLSYTKLHADNDRKVIIPNTILFESVVINLGQK